MRKTSIRVEDKRCEITFKELKKSTTTKLLRALIKKNIEEIINEVIRSSKPRN